MVCIVLRFLATGRFLQVIGDFEGIEKSTTSPKIYIIHGRWVKARGFQRSEVADVHSVLDYIYIKIQSSRRTDAEHFRNPFFFSYNVHVICSSDRKFQHIVCRWPSSAHDSNIFRSSRIRNDFENRVCGDKFLVVDSGYAIKSYTITPLLHPVTQAEHSFNEAQIRIKIP